jgi:HEPN domain-containing protein
VLPIRELRRIARARLKDAELLARGRRFDGSVYLCGYAVEIGLKARICRTLKWSGFPSSPSDFQGLTSFRTHNLDVLLHLSGREETIKKRHMSAWSTFAMWDPEARYLPIGSRSETEATAMLRSAQEVLSAL